MKDLSRRGFFLGFTSVALTSLCSKNPINNDTIEGLEGLKVAPGYNRNLHLLWNLPTNPISRYIVSISKDKTNLQEAIINPRQIKTNLASSITLNDKIEEGATLNVSLEGQEGGKTITKAATNTYIPTDLYRINLFALLQQFQTQPIIVDSVKGLPSQFQQEYGKMVDKALGNVDASLYAILGAINNDSGMRLVIPGQSYINILFDNVNTSSNEKYIEVRDLATSTNGQVGNASRMFRFNNQDLFTSPRSPQYSDQWERNIFNVTSSIKSTNNSFEIRLAEDAKAVLWVHDVAVRDGKLYSSPEKL